MLHSYIFVANRFDFLQKIKTYNTTSTLLSGEAHS